MNPSQLLLQMWESKIISDLKYKGLVNRENKVA